MGTKIWGTEKSRAACARSHISMWQNQEPDTFPPPPPRQPSLMSVFSGAGTQNLGFDHTFRWPGDHRGQCPGERAREQTANCHHGPQDGLGSRTSPKTSLSQVCRAPPFQGCLLCLPTQGLSAGHLPLSPSPEDQRNPRLQVFSLLLGEQASGSADGAKPHLPTPHANLRALRDASA